MTFAEILRLGHALAGVAFFGGMIGRWIVVGFIGRAKTIETMEILVRTARPFGLLLSGGGISLTLLGVAAAISLGRPLFGPLQGGRVDWMFVSVLLMLPIFFFLVRVYPRKGAAIESAMHTAMGTGALTNELAAAWADPVLRAARTYEFIAVTVVLVLMFAKPF